MHWVIIFLFHLILIDLFHILSSHNVNCDQTEFRFFHFLQYSTISVCCFQDACKLNQCEIACRVFAPSYISLCFADHSAVPVPHSSASQIAELCISALCGLLYMVSSPLPSFACRLDFMSFSYILVTILPK